MRHRVKGRKLNRTSSHRRALMRNLVTQLFEHKRIITTEAKAKELRPYAERILTRAMKAYAREQQGLLPEGQTFDIHSRRLIGRDLMSKEVIETLFDEIVPEIGERAGGYTRIVKIGTRLGDGGNKALIELVDYNTEQDPSFKKTKKKKKSTSKETKQEVVEETEVVDTADEVEDVIFENDESSESATENNEVVNEDNVNEESAQTFESDNSEEAVEDTVDSESEVDTETNGSDLNDEAENNEKSVDDSEE